MAVLSICIGLQILEWHFPPKPMPGTRPLIPFLPYHSSFFMMPFSHHCSSDLGFPLRWTSLNLFDPKPIKPSNILITTLAKTQYI